MIGSYVHGALIFQYLIEYIAVERNHQLPAHHHQRPSEHYHERGSAVARTTITLGMGVNFLFRLYVENGLEK